MTMDRRNWLKTIAGFVLGAKLPSVKPPKTKWITFVIMREGFEWKRVYVGSKPLLVARKNKNDCWREWLGTKNNKCVGHGAIAKLGYRIAKLGYRLDELLAGQQS